MVNKKSKRKDTSELHRVTAGDSDEARAERLKSNASALPVNDNLTSAIRSSRVDILPATDKTSKSFFPPASTTSAASPSPCKERETAVTPEPPATLPTSLLINPVMTGDGSKQQGHPSQEDLESIGGIGPGKIEINDHVFVGKGEGFETLSLDLGKKFRELSQAMEGLREELQKTNSKLEQTEEEHRKTVTELERQIDSLKESADASDVKLKELLDDRARRLESMRPVLNAAIISTIAKQFGGKNSGVDHEAPLSRSNSVVKSIISNPTPGSPYETFKRGRNFAYLTKSHLTKLIAATEKMHHERTLIAPPEMSDEELLSLAMEVARAGEEVPYPFPSGNSERTSEVSLIMEIFEEERTRDALIKLVGMETVEMGPKGERIVHKFAPVPMEQIKRYEGYHRLNISDFPKVAGRVLTLKERELDYE